MRLFSICFFTELPRARYLVNLLFLLVLILAIPMVYAEGTRTWQPDPYSKSDLYVTSPSSNSSGVRSFAGYYSQPNMKMYVHIEDPENEMVYLGFSGSGYQFRIVGPSPAGTIVHGPYSVSSPNVTSHALGFAGPDVLTASGYSTSNSIFKFDPSGLPSGDYSIEFSTNLLMPWFDVTVTTKDASPQEIQGRLWSQAWQVSCGSFTSALKAKFYARDEKGYVTQVNFAEAGIKPYVGQFSFNDTGTGSSGNPAADRQSVPNAQSGNPVQKIFLNQPDPNVYPLGLDGQIQNLPLKVEDPANPNVTIDVTQPGRVEVVLDFGTIGNYQEAVDKRLFADLTSGVNTIPWDGTRGDGQKVQPHDYPIPVTISYTQGETHFTAYDVEYLDESFVVRTQTTGGLTSPNVLFWDDSRINQTPGLPPNQKVDTDVGSVARQPWSNFNYGNVNTINTWWFAYRDYVSATVLMPGDYGDAPLSYGASAHKVPDTPLVYLGAIAPDKETELPAQLDGTTDNVNGTADEDAFTALPELAVNATSYDLNVPCVGEGATVAAWIDLDNSTTFESGERAENTCQSGKATLSWSGISGLSVASTYARIRIASNAAHVADPSTGADDGEVEDYPFEIVEPRYDYGDAPNDGVDFNYGVAQHLVPDNDGLAIGKNAAQEDEEAELTTWTSEWTSDTDNSSWFNDNKEERKKAKEPKKDKKDKKRDSNTANKTTVTSDLVIDPVPEVTGDGDEEDGLVVSALTWSNGYECTGLLADGTSGTITMTETRYCVTVNASNSSSIAAQLVAWIDFDQNGVFDDPDERSVVNVDADTSNDDTQGNVPAGTVDEDIVLYWEGLDKLSGGFNSFIRMRLTSDPEFKSNNSPSPIGVAINGEVEDTAIGMNIVGTDYGDAPATYGDASHVIELDAYLGTTIDNEASSQNTANGGSDGTGDDVVDTVNHNYDDDDGVTTFPTLSNDASTYSIDVIASSPATSSANLVGWIDFDGNGTFDADEGATVVVPQDSSEAVITLTWSSIPSDITAGNSYVRLRLTTDTSIATGIASTSSPTGLADYGEVEDYPIKIQGKLDITKTTSTPTVYAGELAEYTITVANNTGDIVSGVTITDAPASTGFFYHSTTSVNLLNTNTANAAPTRTTILNPANLSNPMTWGTFTIPTGDSVEIKVKMNVFSGVGTYNNSVSATTTTAAVIVNDFDGSTQAIDDVEVGNLVCTVNTEPQVFYGSGSADIYAINLTTGEQRTATTSALVATINALATNPDQGGLVYYGSGTNVYYWDPAEGSGASAHHLMKDLNGFANFSGGFLDSGGGAYLDGVYYVGSEAASGTIVDIYALTLSADGKQVLDAQPIGAMPASGNTLGGFGDFIVTMEGLQGTVYGTTDAAGFWKFDIATKQYQQLAAYAGQMSTDQYGQLWRGSTTINPITSAGVVSGSPSYTPLAPIYDLTGPFNCPQIDTDTFDFGDAPASYGSPSHYIPSTPTLYMGSIVPDDETSTELGGDAGEGADGDDTAGTDDEDGISGFPELNDLNETYTIPAANITAVGSGATLHAWIDFDLNGVFDLDEYTSTSMGSDLEWTNVPSDIKAGDSYARFRLTNDPNINGNMPSGQAGDGEVEDYSVTIEVGGFPVKGRVYIDADVDGMNDTSESGVSDLPIVLYDVANDSCVSTRTKGDGSYEFFPVIPGDYQLYEASREQVPVPQNCGTANAKDPAGYLSTTINVLPQFSVVDADITGKDFGDVTMPTFDPDHSGTIVPGNTASYTHKFVAQSTGQVSFTSLNASQQTVGWTSTLFNDANCNGALDSGEGQLAIATPVAVVEGTEMCIINKVYAPANVIAGETFSNEINAEFDYENAFAGTVDLKVTDLSKALASNDQGKYSKLVLKKTVQTYRGSLSNPVSVESVNQNEAKPGDILKYRIYYSNIGNGDLTDLVIKDVVPEFTTLFSSPSCETPLPASLTSCTPSVSNDDIEWLFPANDVLQGGASGMVSYEVKIEP